MLFMNQRMNQSGTVKRNWGSRGVMQLRRLTKITDEADNRCIQAVSQFQEPEGIGGEEVSVVKRSV